MRGNRWIEIDTSVHRTVLDAKKVILENERDSDLSKLKLIFRTRILPDTCVLKNLDISPRECIIFQPLGFPVQACCEPEPESEPLEIPPPSDLLDELVSMGFRPDLSAAALRASKGDLVHAVCLLSGDISADQLVNSELEVVRARIVQDPSCFVMEMKRLVADHQGNSASDVVIRDEITKNCEQFVSSLGLNPRALPIDELKKELSQMVCVADSKNDTFGPYDLPEMVEKAKIIAEMGFPVSDAALALRHRRFDLDRAVNLLISPELEEYRACPTEILREVLRQGPDDAAEALCEYANDLSREQLQRLLNLREFFKSIGLNADKFDLQALEVRLRPLFSRHQTASMPGGNPSAEATTGRLFSSMGAPPEMRAGMAGFDNTKLGTIQTYLERVANMSPEGLASYIGRVGDPHVGEVFARHSHILVRLGREFPNATLRDALDAIRMSAMDEDRARQILRAKASSPDTGMPQMSQGASAAFGGSAGMPQMSQGASAAFGGSAGMPQMSQGAGAAFGGSAGMPELGEQLRLPQNVMLMTAGQLASMIGDSVDSSPLDQYGRPNVLNGSLVRLCREFPNLVVSDIFQALSLAGRDENRARQILRGQVSPPNAGTPQMNLGAGGMPRRPSNFQELHDLWGTNGADVMDVPLKHLQVMMDSMSRLDVRSDPNLAFLGRDGLNFLAQELRSVANLGLEFPNVTLREVLMAKVQARGDADRIRQILRAKASSQT